MFKDFDIQKYLDKKPPSDNSFQTTQEIKELKKIPLSENIVKKFDVYPSAYANMWASKHKC